MREFVVHSVIFVLIAWLLFEPSVSRYFAAILNRRDEFPKHAGVQSGMFNRFFAMLR